MVIAGGVMTANLPHAARNFRRSSPAWGSGEFKVVIRLLPNQIKYRQRYDIIPKLNMSPGNFNVPPVEPTYVRAGPAGNRWRGRGELGSHRVRVEPTCD